MKDLKRILSIIVFVSVTTFLLASATFAGKVMTVLGPISPDKMGITLMHEHFAFQYPGWQADDSVAPYDRPLFEKNWLNVMQTIKPFGVKTIVDPAMNDVGGRDPIALRNTAKKTGMNYVVGTGLYWEGEGANRYYKLLKAVGHNLEDDLCELFTKELTVGIGKTGVKAGIMKLASGDPEISDFEKTVFAAGVRAARAANVPITTHCQGGTVGIKQMELFESLGADPKKIIIGHQNNSVDLQYHLAQLKHPGFFIGFDRISLMNVPKSEENLIKLIKMGYADRITISHDVVVNWPGRPIDANKAFGAPNWYMTYIFKVFIPNAKAAGVTDAQIKTLLVDNPRRLFAADWDK